MESRVHPWDKLCAQSSLNELACFPCTGRVVTDRDTIESTLEKVRSGELTPDQATRILLALERSADAADELKASAIVDAVEGQPGDKLASEEADSATIAAETLGSLTRRLGEPPARHHRRLVLATRKRCEQLRSSRSGGVAGDRLGPVDDRFNRRALLASAAATPIQGTSASRTLGGVDRKHRVISEAVGISRAGTGSRAGASIQAGTGTRSCSGSAGWRFSDIASPGLGCFGELRAGGVHRCCRVFVFPCHQQRLGRRSVGQRRIPFRSAGLARTFSNEPQPTEYGSGGSGPDR